MWMLSEGHGPAQLDDLGRPCCRCWAGGRGWSPLAARAPGLQVSPCTFTSSREGFLWVAEFNTYSPFI